MELNKKKFIYVLNKFSVNSTEHFFHVLNLLENIANNNVQVLLIIEKADGSPEIVNPNIKVVCLKNDGFNRLIELYTLIKNAHLEGYNKLFVRISSWAAITAIINSFFSKLEVYYWHSGTVFEFDNAQPLTFKKVKWYFKTRIPFNFIKKYVTHFVTGPESMKEYYVNVVGVDSSKIKILYNDIDTSRFYKTEMLDRLKIKEELGIPADEKVILFVHNFSAVRKTKMYVANFIQKFCQDKKLNDYIFYFIGNGSDKDDILKEIKEMGLTNRAHFLGSLPNAKVHKYYQIADIFINPTHAEGFPRVLIEAMACGLPIVTTNAGGIKDILGDKQLSYMSDINDSDGFSDNLIKIANLSPLELEALKEENLKGIDKYCTSNVALMYINTIFND